MAVDYKDYYNILGLSKTATEKEIKAAYRSLARQFHPDVNPGDKSAEEKFKDVGEAYEVLSDADKRAKYDQFGDQWKAYSQGERLRSRPGTARAATRILILAARAAVGRDGRLSVLAVWRRQAGRGRRLRRLQRRAGRRVPAGRAAGFRVSD